MLAAGEEGSRLLRYERMNDTAFHRNYKQLLKGEGEREEEVVEERTCDKEREQAAAYVAEHNRKADAYRAEAPNKAIVPENEAPNKAIVPKVAGSSTAVVESSAEWDPEVSALASLAKVMKIYDARREIESFANPVDQVSSVENTQAGGGQGLGHPPDGGGGGATQGSFSPGG